MTKYVNPNYKAKKLKLYRKVLNVIAAVSLTAAAIMAPNIISSLQDYHANDELNNQIVETVVTEDVYEMPNSAQNLKNVNFDELQSMNKDTVGWIECEGTNIDYPVVQGNDNDYYLHHSINKEENAAGTIFMNANNDSNFKDDVTVIYGHNMKNDSMFGSLSEYDNQTYYNQHSKMYYHTADSIYEIDLFAAVNQDATTLTIGDYSDQNQFVTDMNNLKNHSSFSSDVEINKNSKVVCLWTCLDSGSNTNNRYLVYGTVNKVLDKNMVKGRTL